MCIVQSCVEEPGTSPSRRHIQGSKIAKRTSKSQYTVFENRKSKKMDRVASPWRAKRGTLPKLSTFSSQLKGGPFEEKQYSKKSLTMPKNWKGDPLGFSNIHSDAKQQKNWRGTLWRKKISEKKSQCRRKLKDGTLWSRPVWYVTRKNRKNVFGWVRYVKWCNLVQ